MLKDIKKINYEELKYIVNNSPISFILFGIYKKLWENKKKIGYEIHLKQ
jgi:hypothetical protein